VTVILKGFKDKYKIGDSDFVHCESGDSPIAQQNMAGKKPEKIEPALN
jgi:hypothetical protein